MQAATAPVEKVNDIATSVVTTMRQMGVMGLPRNYEIFYEALTGSNHDLSLEVVALSNRPSQEELDRIGRKYFAQNHLATLIITKRAEAVFHYIISNQMLSCRDFIFLFSRKV